MSILSAAAERITSRVASTVHPGTRVLEGVGDVVTSGRDSVTHAAKRVLSLGGLFDHDVQAGSEALKRLDVPKTGVPNVTPQLRALAGFGDMASVGTQDVIKATTPRNIVLLGVNKTGRFGDVYLVDRLQALGHSVRQLDLGTTTTDSAGHLLLDGKPLLTQPDIVIATGVAAKKGSTLVEELSAHDVPVIRGVQELKINLDLAKRFLPNENGEMHPVMEGMEGFATLGSSVRADGVVTAGEKQEGQLLVALIGTNRNVKFGRIRMADELEAAGHQTVQLSIKDIDVIEGRIYHKGKLLPRIDVVMPRGGASMSPESLAMLDKVHDAGIPMVNSPDSIRKMGSKVETSNLLSSEPSIPQPHTNIVETTEDAEAVGLQNVTGSVAKLERGTQGKGVTFVPEHSDPMIRKMSVKSLLETVQALNPEQRLIVQEWVRSGEKRAADYRLHIMAFSDSPHKGSMKRIAAIGELRANTHQGGTAELFEPPQWLIDRAQEAARRTGGGHVSIDFIKTKDGEYLILEMNSSGGVEGIESYTKQNVAKNLIDGIIEGTNKGAFNHG